MKGCKEAGSCSCDRCAKNLHNLAHGGPTLHCAHHHRGCHVECSE